MEESYDRYIINHYDLFRPMRFFGFFFQVEKKTEHDRFCAEHRTKPRNLKSDLFIQSI
jgi:hypothetical protein